MKIHPVNVAVLSALAAWKAGFRCEIEGATPPDAAHQVCAACARTIERREAS